MRQRQLIHEPESLEDPNSAPFVEDQDSLLATEPVNKKGSDPRTKRAEAKVFTNVSLVKKGSAHFTDWAHIMRCLVLITYVMNTWVRLSLQLRSLTPFANYAVATWRTWTTTLVYLSRHPRRMVCSWVGTHYIRCCKCQSWGCRRYNLSVKKRRKSLRVTLVLGLTHHCLILKIFVERRRRHPRG